MGQRARGRGSAITGGLAVRRVLCVAHHMRRARAAGVSGAAVPSAAGGTGKLAGGGGHSAPAWPARKEERRPSVGSGGLSLRLKERGAIESTATSQGQSASRGAARLRSTGRRAAGLGARTASWSEVSFTSPVEPAAARSPSHEAAGRRSRKRRWAKMRPIVAHAPTTPSNDRTTTSRLHAAPRKNALSLLDRTPLQPRADRPPWATPPSSRPAAIVKRFGGLRATTNC